MKKSRLESFSDGVFAIVITLLVLSIHIPEVSYEKLPADLVTILPSVGVYILSFILIGMYWVFHHYSFTFLREVDGVLIWANILFLLFISFLPFPTTLLGRYPFQGIPVIIYGVNLLLPNLIGFFMLIYLRWNPQLTSPVYTDDVFRSQMRIYLGVNGLYILCLVLAFFYPTLSMYAFAAIACYLIFRSAVLMGIGKCNYANKNAEATE